MISSAKLVLIELILAAVSIFAFLRFGNELSNFFDHEEQWSMVCDNLFQINIALVIAFIICIFAEGGLKYRGCNLKTISKQMLALFMFNTIAMALFPVFGRFYFSVVIGCFTGNIIEFVSVSKNIIGAIK